MGPSFPRLQEPLSDAAVQGHDVAGADGVLSRETGGGDDPDHLLGDDGIVEGARDERPVFAVFGSDLAAEISYVALIPELA